MVAPNKNQFAAKPDAEKLTGKGVITVFTGPLKSRCVAVASSRGQKLTEFVRDALREKLEREE